MWANGEISEIVKLTAQFCARNGRQFLLQVTTNEGRNPQFDFLKPLHPLFQLFQQLTAAYSLVIRPEDGYLDGLRQDLAKPERILERVLARKKYQQQIDDAKKQKDRDNEEERGEFFQNSPR